MNIGDASRLLASLRLLRWLRVALVVGMLGAAPHAARAQQPRPWLDWQTVETPHFVLHYPREYRQWTLALAERIEGIREQVTAIVGYTPAGRVHIVVDDPVNSANGTAYTPLDGPTIVLFAVPPEPRDEIGNYAAWDELVATHEFAHIAHLARPSRNHWQNLLWSLSPVPLGPVALESPRWAREGFATYVEGRATGGGRPNHAWRSAILRQFALEGRLPPYSQLDASGGWETGSFAYLAGSAYFEWLARREGDSSVTAIWKRLSAKTVRSFDGAFAGVYGDGPAQLYGRFTAELTADALAFERNLAQTSMVPGVLVQHLVRNTGDPAISPDGRFIALTVRRPNAPSQLVVWRTADEPDTAAANRRESQQRRDRDDVPDRSFYPPPRRIVISLTAPDGASYESPRWLPDNRRLLVTRLTPLADGTLRPDVSIWSAEDGSLVRFTRGASLRNPDPSADGTWAAATRCEQGWCDLVRLDLATGAVRIILGGSPERNFYRPRVSKRTGEIIAAEQSGDRWRIVRVDPRDGAWRYADPNDGANRYDATFEPDGHTIVTTSDRDGVANIERLDGSGGVNRLTAVTGAAVAADVAPDGTLWFLSLHAAGYDLRKLKPDSLSIARANGASSTMHLGLIDTFSPVLPPVAAQADSAHRPPKGIAHEEVSYNEGPSRFRYVPAFTTGYGGSSGLLSLVRSDPVGRLGIALTGAAGAGALPEGAALTIISRASRNVLTLNGWVSHEAPSSVYEGAYAEGLNLLRFGSAARLGRETSYDGGERSISVGAIIERQRPRSLPAVNRAAGQLALAVARRERDEDTRYAQQFTSVIEAGRTDGGLYYRQRSSFSFAIGSYTAPLTVVRVAYGSLGGDGRPREQFVIGGFTSPLLDPQLDGRHVEQPAYPTGTLAGSSFSSYRVSTPLPPVELFYTGASPDFFHSSLRSYGAELREHVAAIPVLGVPDIGILAGFARAMDAPVAREWRYYMTVTVSP